MNSESAAAATKNSTIGFLLFEKDRQNAQPVGTGTLVRVGFIRGIITAAHVLKCLPKSGEIGIVLFPTCHAVKQNLTLEMNFTSNLIIWDGIEGHHPDIGFLRLTSPTIAAIEATGCVFCNLESTSKLIESSGHHRTARFWGIAGVIAEWAADLPGSNPKTRIKNVQGLFLAIRNPHELQHNDSDLLSCKIHYSADARVPTSYGGVSGGGLWEFEAELRDNSIIAMEKKLSGVAFSESDVVAGERLINCQGRKAIDSLVSSVRTEWMTAPPSIERHRP